MPLSNFTNQQNPFLEASTDLFWTHSRRYSGAKRKGTVRVGLLDAAKIHPIPAFPPSCHLSRPPHLTIQQDPPVHQDLSSNLRFLSQQDERTRNCLILPFLSNSHSVTIYHPEICVITALSHRNLGEENGTIPQKLRAF